MTLPTAISTCLRKYVTFSGRAPRSEYWWFVLAVFLGSLLAGALDAVFFGFDPVSYEPGQVSYESNGPIAVIFGLATLLPLTSVGWRRMHDSGRSGLHLLYPLIVVVGIITFMGVVTGFDTVLSGNFAQILAGGSAIVLGIAVFVFFISPLLVLWWLTRPSEPRTNAYGPPPPHIASTSD